MGPQALALHLGQLSVVQPVLITALPMTPAAALDTDDAAERASDVAA